MSLPSDELVGARRPTYRTGPRARRSKGEDAVVLAELAGLELDDWQQDVLEAALAVRARGRWAAFEVGLIVPRQNGKGAILEALELHALFRDPDCRLILHSAHEFKTAKEAFRRVVGLIDSNPKMKARARIRYTTGEEGVELDDGSRLKFVARSSGSGRGFSGDLVILDEAYNLSDDMMSALLPTMSARPNPQIWYTSSAPLSHNVSDVLRRLCRRGRGGQSHSLTYFEWCAPYGSADDDPDALAAANPGLGIRLNEDVIEAERGSLDPSGFARERLGIWHEHERESPFGAGKWESCADPDGKRPESVRLSFDLAPKSTSAAIGVAGRLGDRWFGDVADHGDGTDWLIEELLRLWRKLKPDRPVAYSDRSPAASIAPKIEAAGVPVEAVTTAQHAEACGALFVDVVEGRFHHPDRPELNVAVYGAEQSDSGDSWLWSRRKSDVDISPLVAVTLARWAAAQPPAKRVLTEASVW